MKIPLVYIAGPFRGKTPFDVKCNVHEAEVLGLEVATLGGYPVIPHSMTCHFDKQLTDVFWLAGKMEMLRRCDAIMLSPRWEQSTGARAEKEEAARLELPAFYRANQIMWKSEFTYWLQMWQTIHPQ
jgi:hypothetical protein